MVELSAKNYFSFKWNNNFLNHEKKMVTKIKIGKNLFLLLEEQRKTNFQNLICVFIIAI